jgi:hypothetical protein
MSLVVLYLYLRLPKRAMVESEGNFVARGRSSGNEKRRWHGTSRDCTIGDEPRSVHYCASPTCALCSILRFSFRMTLTGTAPGRKFARQVIPQT